ncbi:Class II aaRS and biotin synthetase [Glarea lozoyensis ATCC 20868]|uniref:Class II aaRS and biotin synthetase n=1 Tax=Glarea lozoyensis (strain ATCC 20868 / MF5171) TaxID=1116229 RepID=S3DAH9_GLAL2|nr:Class II aaRS and biotin synthetase [Glarea lozoyensis ATCC 20868]EPE28981.1 Class II aaRS and biotin synthetase [Glarea lozoyensis ATCC 20868]
MAPRKLNVLVYSGNGSTIESVRHCLYTLRRLLSPNYAVISITDTVILKEPWTASCALLVFPGGADLGYCRSLNGEGNRRIEQYVRRGGAYLGFCAGAYYGSSRCEFEVGNKKLEVVGSRELSFFPGICRGCAFKGFVYHSEEGAKAVRLDVNKEAFGGALVPETFKSYYNGGGLFVDAKKFADKGVETLATYTDSTDVEGGDGPAAVVYCKIGEGGALLTGPHPEFAAVNLDPKSDGPGYPKVVKDIAQDDELRVNFLKACLAKLGLVISQESSSVPSLSRLHLSSQHHYLVGELLSSWEDIITVENGEEYIIGENDTFHFEKQESRWSLNNLVKSLPSLPIASQAKEHIADEKHVAVLEDRIVDYDKITKRIITHEDQWPGTKETPYFNHHSYYANLKKYQQETGGDAEDFGKYLLYGEVITSTNTILEKNTKLLSLAPDGFTATATTQVAGRGRGSNVWVSPAGSLVFSVCLKHPMELSNVAPVVFIQYLAAIAIVEGIQSYDEGYKKVPVKLKWPNDIYAQDPSKPGKKEYAKIGGILVNSSYSNGNYDLVVGIGLNTTNAAPTTSLNALLPSTQTPFTLEKLLARILTKFEVIYKRFCRNGFDRNLEQVYYDHWLHTDQIVTIETEGGARARIKGITRNWGLLLAEELGWEDRPTGKVWELQSDSNSFDFFKGLLKRKI